MNTFDIGQLSIGDFRVVRKAIWDVRAKWCDVGVELCLDVNSLDVIKKDYQKVDECFSMMLKSWLNQECAPQPTWSALVEALKSPIIDNPRLAQELEEKYSK